MTEENIAALLPWYVNGTLSADEQEKVKQALSESESLREELSFLESLSSSVKAETPPEASELGWRRLQKEIQAEGVASNNQSEEQASETKVSWFKPLIASAAVLMIALQVNLTMSPSEEDSSRLLSGPSVVLTEPHWRLQLEIADQAPWQDIYALTGTLNAAIIDGPSSLGIISIAVPKKGSQYQDVNALMTWLEKQPAISYVAIQE